MLMLACSSDCIQLLAKDSETVHYGLIKYINECDMNISLKMIFV